MKHQPKLPPNSRNYNDVNWPEIKGIAPEIPRGMSQAEWFNEMYMCKFDLQEQPNDLKFTMQCCIIITRSLFTECAEFKDC